MCQNAPHSAFLASPFYTNLGGLQNYCSLPLFSWIPKLVSFAWNIGGWSFPYFFLFCSPRNLYLKIHSLTFYSWSSFLGANSNSPLCWCFMIFFQYFKGTFRSPRTLILTFFEKPLTVLPFTPCPLPCLRFLGSFTGSWYWNHHLSLSLLSTSKELDSNKTSHGFFHFRNGHALFLDYLVSCPRPTQHLSDFSKGPTSWEWRTRL